LVLNLYVGFVKNTILIYNSIGVKNCIKDRTNIVSSSKGLAFISIRISSNQNEDHKSSVAPRHRFAFLFTFIGLENRIKEISSKDEKTRISIK
jgi:hypothetical protein